MAQTKQLCCKNVPESKSNLDSSEVGVFRDFEFLVQSSNELFKEQVIL